MVKNRVLTISLVIHLSLLDWTESSDVINNFGIETKQGSQLSLLYKKLQDPTYQCSPVESASQEEMGPDIFVNTPCDSTGVNVIKFFCFVTDGGKNKLERLYLKSFLMLESTRGAL
jgi:hypothetical protein